jgi:hypothetical protein
MKAVEPVSWSVRKLPLTVEPSFNDAVAKGMDDVSPAKATNEKAKRRRDVLNFMAFPLLVNSIPQRIVGWEEGDMGTKL